MEGREYSTPRSSRPPVLPRCVAGPAPLPTSRKRSLKPTPPPRRVEDPPARSRRMVTRRRSEDDETLFPAALPPIDVSERTALVPAPRRPLQVAALATSRRQPLPKPRKRRESACGPQQPSAATGSPKKRAVPRQRPEGWFRKDMGDSMYVAAPARDAVEGDKSTVPLLTGAIAEDRQGSPPRGEAEEASPNAAAPAPVPASRAPGRPQVAAERRGRRPVPRSGVQMREKREDKSVGLSTGFRGSPSPTNGDTETPARHSGASSEVSLTVDTSIQHQRRTSLLQNISTSISTAFGRFFHKGAGTEQPEPAPRSGQATRPKWSDDIEATLNVELIANDETEAAGRHGYSRVQSPYQDRYGGLAAPSISFTQIVNVRRRTRAKGPLVHRHMDKQQQPRRTGKTEPEESHTKPPEVVEFPAKVPYHVGKQNRLPGRGNAEPEESSAEFPEVVELPSELPYPADKQQQPPRRGKGEPDKRSAQVPEVATEVTKISSRTKGRRPSEGNANGRRKNERKKSASASDVFEKAIIEDTEKSEPKTKGKVAPKESGEPILRKKSKGQIIPLARRLSSKDTSQRLAAALGKEGSAAPMSSERVGPDALLGGTEETYAKSSAFLSPPTMPDKETRAEERRSSRTAQLPEVGEAQRGGKKDSTESSSSEGKRKKRRRSKGERSAESDATGVKREESAIVQGGKETSENKEREQPLVSYGDLEQALEVLEEAALVALPLERALLPLNSYERSTAADGKEVDAVARERQLQPLTSAEATAVEPRTAASSLQPCALAQERRRSTQGSHVGAHNDSGRKGPDGTPQGGPGHVSAPGADDGRSNRRREILSEKQASRKMQDDANGDGKTGPLVPTPEPGSPEGAKQEDAQSPEMVPEDKENRRKQKGRDMVGDGKPRKAESKGKIRKAKQGKAKGKSNGHVHKQKHKHGQKHHGHGHHKHEKRSRKESDEASTRCVETQTCLVAPAVGKGGASCRDFNFAVNLTPITRSTLASNERRLSGRKQAGDARRPSKGPPEITKTLSDSPEPKSAPAGENGSGARSSRRKSKRQSKGSKMARKQPRKQMPSTLESKRSDVKREETPEGDKNPISKQRGSDLSECLPFFNNKPRLPESPPKPAVDVLRTEVGSDQAKEDVDRSPEEGVGDQSLGRKKSKKRSSSKGRKTKRSKHGRKKLGKKGAQQKLPEARESAPFLFQWRPREVNRPLSWSTMRIGTETLWLLSPAEDTPCLENATSAKDMLQALPSSSMVTPVVGVKGEPAPHRKASEKPEEKRADRLDDGEKDAGREESPSRPAAKKTRGQSKGSAGHSKGGRRSKEAKRKPTKHKGKDNEASPQRGGRKKQSKRKSGSRGKGSSSKRKRDKERSPDDAGPRKLLAPTGPKGQASPLERSTAKETADQKAASIEVKGELNSHKSRKSHGRRTKKARGDGGDIARSPSSSTAQASLTSAEERATTEEKADNVQAAAEEGVSGIGRRDFHFVIGPRPGTRGTLPRPDLAQVSKPAIVEAFECRQGAFVRCIRRHDEAATRSGSESPPSEDWEGSGKHRERKNERRRRTRLDSRRSKSRSSSAARRGRKKLRSRSSKSSFRGKKRGKRRRRHRKNSRRRRRRRDRGGRRRRGKSRSRRRKKRSRRHLAVGYSSPTKGSAFYCCMFALIAFTAVIALCVGLLYYYIFAFKPRHTSPDTTAYSVIIDTSPVSTAPTRWTDGKLPSTATATPSPAHPPTPVPPRRGVYYCSSPDCSMQAHHIFRSLASETNPCDNFYEHVCARWKQYYSDKVPRYGSFVSQETLHEDRLLGGFISDINNLSRSDLHVAQKLYVDCVNWRATKDDILKSTMKAVFEGWTIHDWPRT
ncbi:uncharacterized protein LOC142559223 [Dermacentor variabilis]|uniref:uncharacterized protein LOC142559223 n=1 Tax=Dermacentor variabilis TaxID=34621 RepID=UPI003F5C5E5E